MNTISIAYGVEGEPAVYSYQITQHGSDQMNCELRAGGKTIERERFEWRSDLQALSRDLLNDFAQGVAKIETAGSVPKDQRKKIVVVCGGSGWGSTVEVTGSDEALAAFIARSVVIQELFGKVSSGKPKMYRLWETPGPMGSFLTPLSPEEKEAASRKPKENR